MALCECGCREEAKHGQFLPGHDQRLRTSLEQRVGGLLALRMLIEAAACYADGLLAEDTFTQQVRSVFAAARRT